MGHCECRDGCPLGCYVIRDQCICPPTDIKSAPFCCPGCTGWCSGFGCMGYCPYENLIQESCSSLAVQAHGESCKSDCADISNSGCQSCLETSLPDNLFYFILTSAWLIRNKMCTTLNFRSVGPQVTAVTCDLTRWGPIRTKIHTPYIQPNHHHSVSYSLQH